MNLCRLHSKKEAKTVAIRKLTALQKKKVDIKVVGVMLIGSVWFSAACR